MFSLFTINKKRSGATTNSRRSSGVNMGQGARECEESAVLRLIGEAIPCKDSYSEMVVFVFAFQPV